MVEITASKTSISNLDIENFEKYLKHKLPNDYVEFLLKYNGGNIESNQIIFDDGLDTAIECFLGINTHDDNNDIKYSYEILKDSIPDGFLPIADLCFGNMIMLDLKNDGEVYFWDHELELDSESLTMLCNSFTELLDLIKEYNDTDDSFKIVEETYSDPDFDEEQRRLGNMIDDD